MKLGNIETNLKPKGSLPKNPGEAALWRLLEKSQEAYGLGNDGGETSQIRNLIAKIENNKEVSENEINEATEKANEIIYAKEAGIDSRSGGH